MTAGLVNPTLLVTLHRDINDLAGMDGKGLGKSKKQQALRWGVFTMTYATTEAFFNGLLNKARRMVGYFR